MEENEPNNCEDSEKSCSDQQDAPQDMDESTEVNGFPADGATKVTIDYSSDSSESNEKCPICLLSFYDQEIGTPDMCSHAFCASCIEAWAKMMKTCPIDRKSFATINIYQNYENRVYLRSVTVTISVLNSLQNDLPMLLTAAAPTVLQPPPVILVDVDRPGDKCEICHRADREDVMLLCDECDCGYHIDCLVPALQEIPHGSWYCSNCPQELETAVGANKFGLARPGVVEDGENYVEPVRKKSRQVAQITRTKQSELIRKTIMAILSRTKPGGRERRRKKRGRRSRPDPRNVHPDFDPSLRLPTRSSQRCGNHNDQLQQRSHFRERIPMLNLFGSANELEEIYNNDEENDDYSNSFEPVRMGARPLYASQPEGEVSSQVVCRQIVGFRNMQNILKIKNIIRTPRERPMLRVTPTTAPPNLLDSIMESQQIWHSKDGIKDVIVAKGGNISLKRRTFDAKANAPVTDGLDTAAGASSTSSSTAVINRNYYQNNNTTSQGVAGASHYQSQASSSRNSSNLTQLTNTSGLSDIRPGGQAALPVKKTIKDMFCDSESDDEPPKPTIPMKRPPRRFSENAPQPERNDNQELAMDACIPNDPPSKVVEPEAESYTPELRYYEEAAQEAVVPTISQPVIPVTAAPSSESLMTANKASYPKEKSKNRRPRSKSKEPEKDRKKSVDHKKKTNRRHSSSRSRSKSRRRTSSHRRSRNSRSRSRSRNRSGWIKSRERNRRFSRSPVARKKVSKRRKSRSKSRSKSVVGNRSRSRSLNRNNKTWSGRKTAGKRKPRSHSRSRSGSRLRDRKVRSWRNRSPSPFRSIMSPPYLPTTAKVSGKKPQAEVPPKVDAIVYTQDPVAIIDLTNGVKEIPSEKEVIVVSDSDHENEPALEVVAPLPEPVVTSNVDDEPVNPPSTPPDVEMDEMKTPSPVITATTSPHKSPAAVEVVVDPPFAHASQVTGQLPLPVEIQKLLQTFDTEKLLNNNLLSQINLVSPFRGPPLPPFVPLQSVVAAAIPSIPELETGVVPPPLPPVEPAPPAAYDSPYSPGSSDFNDVCTETSFNVTTSESGVPDKPPALSASSSMMDPKSDFDDLFGQSPNENSYDEMLDRRLSLHKDDDAIFEEKKARIFSDPRDKDKYLVKLSLQKRASDEAKEQLKPFYSTKQITKQEYKDILRSAVPKICRSREVNPLKIQSLIAAYVKKMQHQRKKK